MNYFSTQLQAMHFVLEIVQKPKATDVIELSKTLTAQLIFVALLSLTQPYSFLAQQLPRKFEPNFRFWPPGLGLIPFLLYKNESVDQGGQIGRGSGMRWISSENLHLCQTLNANKCKIKFCCSEEKFVALHRPLLKTRLGKKQFNKLYHLFEFKFIFLLSSVE